MSERQSYYIGIKGIIKNKKGEVLILKYTSTGKWATPGGRMDANQTIEGSFAREISEEIEGARLRNFGGLIFAAQGDFFVENNHKLLLLFYGVEVDLPSTIILSSEHSEFAWVDTGSLADYEVYSSDRAAIELALG